MVIIQEIVKHLYYHGSPTTGFSTDSPSLCMTVDAYVLADIIAKFRTDHIIFQYDTPVVDTI